MPASPGGHSTAAGQWKSGRAQLPKGIIRSGCGAADCVCRPRGMREQPREVRIRNTAPIEINMNVICFNSSFSVGSELLISILETLRTFYLLTTIIETKISLNRPVSVYSIVTRRVATITEVMITVFFVY